MTTLANVYILRSLNTSIPSSLANGQLSYTANGDILYIGSNGNIVPISGARTPGTLTANQALVANSTSYLDVVKTAKLFLTGATSNVTTINVVANSTVLGTAVNTEITSTWAIKTYVDAKVSGAAGSPGGANTYIQFNDSSAFNGTAGFTFDDTINTVSIANTLLVGANVTLDTIKLLVGNTVANLLANSILVSIANSTGIANLQPTKLTIATSVVNSTAFGAGANVFLSTVALSIGNATVNTFINSSSIATTGSLSCQDATVSGNLLISGTVTTVNTVNLTVHDPLIKLAKDNDTTDAIDVGFYGLCDPTGSQDTFMGLFRDASDSKFKFFDLLQSEPTTTVDTTGTGYHQATLVVALESNNVNITGGVIDCGSF